jgi:hypothetical protein
MAHLLFIISAKMDYFEYLRHYFFVFPILSLFLSIIFVQAFFIQMGLIFSPAINFTQLAEKLDL